MEGDGETPSRYRKWKSFDYVRHGGDQHWSPAEVEDLEARDGERDTLFSGAACDDVEGEEDEEDDDDEEPVGAAAEAVSEAAIAEDAVEEEKGT